MLCCVIASLAKQGYQVVTNNCSNDHESNPFRAGSSSFSVGNEDAGLTFDPLMDHNT